MGRSHYFKGCPSKDSRISIVVPPTDVGYNGNVFTLYGNVPTFDPQIPLFYRYVPTFGLVRLATMQWGEHSPFYSTYHTHHSIAWSIWEKEEWQLSPSPLPNPCTTHSIVWSRQKRAPPPPPPPPRRSSIMVHFHTYPMMSTNQ